MLNYSKKEAIEVRIKSRTITKLGDMGAPLEGLKKIYYNPKAFKVLPYRHNFTQTGEYELTGFFIPYFVQALDPQYMDHRGVCDIERYKEAL
jgi:hypothetical protein